jgi:phosphoribosyl 1,2-cyclic phosphodiesterase
MPSHISLSDLEANAGALTAARVLLAHLGEEMLRHADEAPWPCAADGLVVEL